MTSEISDCPLLVLVQLRIRAEFLQTCVIIGMKGKSNTGRMGWMAHRKWKEAKQLPGTAGPVNMLGCCLINFHFLWAIHPIRPVLTCQEHDFWRSPGAQIPPTQHFSVEQH